MASIALGWACNSARSAGSWRRSHAGAQTLPVGCIFTAPTRGLPKRSCQKKFGTPHRFVAWSAWCLEELPARISDTKREVDRARLEESDWGVPDSSKTKMVRKETSPFLLTVKAVWAPEVISSVSNVVVLRISSADLRGPRQDGTQEMLSWLMGSPWRSPIVVDKSNV